MLEPRTIRQLIAVLMLVASMSSSHNSLAQCGLLSPTVSESFNTSNVCAAVSVNWSIQYGFIIPPTDPSRVYIRYNWGDPANTITDVPAGCVTTNCSAFQTFNYPSSASDCEYFPSVTLAYDDNGNGTIESGELCLSSEITKQVISWSTDDAGSGSLAINPVNINNCVGVAESGIQFQDASIPNCTGASVTNKNTFIRWVQFVYGTNNDNPSNIPNVYVDSAGVPVQITDATGNVIHTMYGPVIQINSPVSEIDLDELSYEISYDDQNAIGQTFEVTLRNWNFCNAYDNNAFDANPPLDLINGDNPPVETSAFIEIEGPTVANAGTDIEVCGNSALMNANTAIVGNGSWTQISGPGTLSFNDNSESTGVTISANDFGTYEATWNIDLNGCISRDTIQLTFFEQPSNPITGPDEQLCALSTTLTANNPAVGFGTWVQVGGPTGLNIADSLDRNTSITAINYGVYTLEWQTQNAICPIKTEPIEITFFENPSNAIAGPDLLFCGNNGTLGATPLSVGTGEWTIINSPTSSNPILNDFSDPASSLDVDVFGIYSLEWASSNGNCPEKFDTVEVEFAPLPSDPNAGPDKEICGTSTSLEGNVLAIGQGEWFVISGPSTPGISNAFDNNATISVTNFGTYTLEWRATNANCSPKTDQVNLTFYENPSDPNAGIDQNICGLNTTLNGSNPAVGTGEWFIVSSPVGSNPVLNNSLNNSSSFQSDVYGDYSLIWQSSNGVCANKSDTVVINFADDPSIPDAGIDQDICGLSTALNAGTPAIGQGNWSQISGPSSGSFTDTLDEQSLFTASAYGVYTLSWETSNSTCPTLSDIVEIEFFDQPSNPNAGLDQVICGRSTSLNAQIPSVGTGEWIIVQSPSGSNPGLNNPLDNNSAFQSDSFGDYLLVWQVQNGPCPLKTDTVQISFERNPSIANAGPDQDICGLNTSLNALIPQIGIGEWSQISGPGTINFNDNQNNQTSITASAYGVYVLEWENSNANCPTSSDQIEIEFFDNPSNPDAGIDQVVCGRNTSLNASIPSIGNGEWLVISNPAASNPTFSNSLDNTSAFQSDSFGDYLLAWEVDNGPCPSVFDTVLISFERLPSPANAGLDLDFCGLSGSLSAVLPQIGSSSWSQISGSGTITFTDSSDNQTGILANNFGVYTLQWEISNANCPSNTDQMTVEFFDDPSNPNAGPDQVLCGNSAILAAVDPIIGNGSWFISTSPQGSSPQLLNPTAFNSAFQVDSFGTYILIWETSNGPCNPKTDTVSITFVDAPDIPNAGPDEDVCGLSTVLNANTPTSGLAQWNIISGASGLTLSDSTSPNSLFTASSYGTYILEWQIDNGICPVLSDQVSITFSDNPSIANAGSDVDICGVNTILNANQIVIGTGQWSVISSPLGSSPVITNVFNRNSTFSIDSFGVYELAWTASNGACPSNEDTVRLTFFQSPDIAVTGPNGAFCDTTTTLLANVPSVGIGTWVQTLGPSGLQIVNPNDPFSSIIASAYGDYTLEWRISNGNCPIQSDPIEITFDENPTPADAGPDRLICGNSTNLEANIISVGNGVWSVASTPTGVQPGFSIGDPNSPISVNPLGVYEMQWTSTNGVCPSDSDIVKISFVENPSFSVQNLNDASCYGFCDGTAALLPLSGTAPFFYTWEDEMFSGSFQNSLCAGDYNVIMTDINGCQFNDVISIDEPDSFNISYSATPATCGNFDGVINLTVNGGVGALDYRWNTGSTNQDIDSISAGLYVVTITDQNGCRDQLGVTLNNIGGPNLNIANINDVSCYGLSDGSIDVIANGQDLVYLWSNGARSQDVINLPAGAYQLSVLDSVSKCLSFLEVDITEPNEIVLDLSITNATCGANDGAVSVVVEGGNGNNTINWSSGGSGPSVSGLSAGVYSVTVNDFKGCSSSENFSISEIGAPIIFLDSILNIECGSPDSGAIYVSTTGNPAELSYLWSNGDTMEDLLSAPEGLYDLEVTDTLGCRSYFVEEIRKVSPSELQICFVQVDSATNFNQVIWKRLTNAAKFSHVNIYRETTRLGNFQLIGSLQADSVGLFVDTVSNSFVKSYRYSISTVDTCGIESDLSPAHKTIHLVQSLGLANNSVNLQWDNYEGFAYNNVEIFRNSSTNGFELIASLPSNLNSYTDIPPFPIADTLLFYVIKLTTPQDCDPTKDTDYSRTRSNPSSKIFDPEGGGTALDRRIEANEVRIYPNPGKEIIQIDFENYYEFLGVSIKTISGSEIKRIDNYQNKSIIDISDIESGIYLVHIKFYQTSIIKKLIISK